MSFRDKQDRNSDLYTKVLRWPSVLFRGRQFSRKNFLLEQLIRLLVFWACTKDWEQYIQHWTTRLSFHLSVGWSSGRKLDLVDLCGNSQTVLGSNPSPAFHFSYSYAGQMTLKFRILSSSCSWSNFSTAHWLNACSPRPFSLIYIPSYSIRSFFSCRFNLAYNQFILTSVPLSVHFLISYFKSPYTFTPLPLHICYLLFYTAFFSCYLHPLRSLLFASSSDTHGAAV